MVFNSSFCRKTCVCYINFPISLIKSPVSSGVVRSCSKTVPSCRVDSHFKKGLYLACFQFVCCIENGGSILGFTENIVTTYLNRPTVEMVK